MNPYVSFEVSGIEGVTVEKGRTDFLVDNDNVIEKVEIIQENNTFKGFRFDLKKGTSIDASLVSKLTAKAQRFAVNIYGKCNPFVSEFSLKPNQIYDPQNDDNESIMATIPMGVIINMRLGIVRPIRHFKEMFEQYSPHSDADDYYSLLFNAMKTNNIVARYLFQYEILLSLVAPNHCQKEVTEYIKTKYNPNAEVNKIGFSQTRKEIKKKYDEDNITYYRNLLGHNDGSSEVNDKKTNEMSKDLANVLFYAMNNV